MGRLMHARRATVFAAVAGLTIMGAGLSQGTANAAPKKGTPIVIVCDNGVTYTGVTSPGNGDYTPAHASNGATLVPKAFGESTFNVYDASGALVESDTQPATAKKAATSNKNATLHCTFTGTQSFVMDGATYTGVFSGSVTGILAGKK